MSDKHFIAGFAAGISTELQKEAVAAKAAAKKAPGKKEAEAKEPKAKK